MVVENLNYTIRTKTSPIYKFYNPQFQDVKILENVSCIFPRKKLCSIVGPSGCGKTTLLNILSGRVFHDKQENFIHGQFKINNEYTVYPPV